MESSPSKRRKTSPNASIPVTASNTESLSTANDGSHAAHPRSSYMSPTKASLARFNPGLLPRSGSVEPQRQSAALAAAQRARTEDRDLRPNFEPPRKTPLRSEDTPNGIDRQTGRVSPSVLEDTPSKIPKTTASRQPPIHLQSNGQARTPNRRRRRRLSHERDSEAADEPSLPSTPSQLGLEAPAEKPRGLLFQTSNLGRNTNNDSLENEAQNVPGKAHDLRALADETQMIGRLGPRVSMTVQAVPPINYLPRNAQKERVFQRTENRLVTIQERLTTLSLHLTPSNESTTKKKSRIRMKKLLGQDARFIRAAILEGHVPRERYESASGTPFITPGSTSDTRTGAHLLARYLPFSSHLRWDRGTPHFDSTLWMDDGDEQHEGQRTEIAQSLIKFDEDTSIGVQHVARLIRQESEMIAGLNLTVDPLTQTVITISPYSMAPWAKKGLEPWINHHGAARSLQKVADVIRRCLELTDARQACWAECSRTLRDLIPRNFRASNASPSLDRQTFELSKAGVETEIDWRVVVNDDGTVQSDVQLRPSIPARWRELDTDDVLDSIGTAFGHLIREKGVQEAIETIGRVIYP